MEILSIQKWMESGCGAGDGDGCGYGVGSGAGSGAGSGRGYMGCLGSGTDVGSGKGFDYGPYSDYGFGYGECLSYKDGFAYGCGSCEGSGDGSGDGTDIKFFCGSPVYEIDGIPTIITAVFGNYAKGYILEQSLTLKPCYIAKKESHFAHGETLRKAVESVNEKAFANMPEYGGEIIRKLNEDGENE